MNIKTFVAFVIVALIVVVAMPFLRDNHKESGPSNDSSGFAIGTNALYVAEQAPSNTLSVATVRLEKPGFVVVFDDARGTPGTILGKSDLLSGGETEDLPPIPLSRMTRDGETLYAALHIDNGDGIFDMTKDKPALDQTLSLPIMMIVTVGGEAAELPDAVSL